ncbi:MAG TPA: aminoglycoside phosphotransferase family protein [Thermomicrobiales bacterium]|nr:aminoglycoside phosphotransferase family protein [Thermomicrobiales bacterium]
MLAALLRVINERHGAAFTPGARYPTGEQGAFAIFDGAGPDAGRFVLKWRRADAVPDGVRAAVATTGRLRAAGYPAPRYRLVGVAPALGVCYSVQEALPGAPLGGLRDGALLDQLLALNDLQRGRAGAGRDWPGYLVETVLRGGDGYCLLEPLRRHSAATADLLAAVQRLAAGHAAERAPAGDVVHFDFQGANILVDGGRVSGVVDWEGTRAGDRAFDLATLLFCMDGGGAVEPALQARLWRELRARTTPGLRRLYLAHMILRQVDWAIRFYGQDVVDRYLRRADEMLRLLAADADRSVLSDERPPQATSWG